MVMVNRFFGSFVFVPGLIASTAVSFTMYPTLLRRPVLVIGTFAVAFVLPLVLEAAGVWASTWTITDHHMVFSSPVLDLASTPSAVFLIVGNLFLIALAPLFVYYLARGRFVAQRQLAIQAWHLEQLLPARG
jgi:hypothetical protein